MNKLMLKGRLTADPVIKKTQNDLSVCTFTVAVNRRFDKEKTDFITCEAWRQTADFIGKYFSKGKEILVCGELHIDKYVKDGQTRFITKVVVDEVDFCGGSSEKTETTTTSEFVAVTPAEEDDLPF